MILKNIITVLFFVLLGLRPFISSLASPQNDILYTIVLLITACGILIINKKKESLCKHPATPFLALLIFAILISTLFSKDSQMSLSQFYKFSAVLFTFYAVVSLKENEKKILIPTLLTSSVLVSFHALQWLMRGSMYALDYLRAHYTNWNFAFEYISRGRAFVPFVLPSALGGYLILFAPLGFILLFENNNSFPMSKIKISPKNTLALIAVLLISLALLATQSLGAILSLTAALFIFVLTQKKRIKSLFFAFIALLACGLLLLALRYTNTHFFNIPLFSLTSRLSFWKQAIIYIRQHPLIGFGLGNYPFYKSTTPHNSYLQIWAETGVLGFIALVGIVYKTLKINFSLVDEKQRKIYMGLWIGSLAFIIHNLIDFTFFQPEVAIQWWAIAALLSTHSYTPRASLGACRRMCQAKHGMTQTKGAGLHKILLPAPSFLNYVLEINIMTPRTNIKMPHTR